MHGVATLKNWWVVIIASSQYLSTHFLRDLPCHKTKKILILHQVSLMVGNLYLAPAEILDSKIPLYFATLYLLIWHSLWVQPKSTWSRNDVGSDRSTSFMSTFHVGLTFCFFTAKFIPSTYTDIRNNLLLVWQRSNPSFKLFPNHVPKELSQIALAIIAPAKRWPCRFISRRTTGSSILDHDFGHLSFGRRIPISGHSEFGSSFQTLMHLPFSPKYAGILHLLLALRTLAIWYKVHEFCGWHLRCWWSLLHNTAYDAGSSFTMQPWSKTLPLCFWLLKFQLRILEKTEIHQWRKMNVSAIVPCFFYHFFLISDFRQLPCQNFLQFFPVFLFCRLCIWTFSCLKHRNKIMHHVPMTQWIHSFCIDVILMRFVSSSFSPWSRAFVGINNTSVFRLSQHCGWFHHCSLLVFCKALLASELPTFYERLS